MEVVVIPLLLIENNKGQAQHLVFVSTNSIAVPVFCFVSRYLFQTNVGWPLGVCLTQGKIIKTRGD